MTEAAPTQGVVPIVRFYARSIHNGRTARNIFNHARGELKELEDELDLKDQGEAPGPDGVIGEAVDVMQCMLDLIFHERPDITDEEIDTLMRTKCVKWRAWYSNSILKASAPQEIG